MSGHLKLFEKRDTCIIKNMHASWQLFRFFGEALDVSFVSTRSQTPFSMNGVKDNLISTKASRGDLEGPTS